MEQVEYSSHTTALGLLISLSDKPSTFNVNTSAFFLPTSNKWLEPSLPLTMYNIENGVSIGMILFFQIESVFNFFFFFFVIFRVFLFMVNDMKEIQQKLLVMLVEDQIFFHCLLMLLIKVHHQQLE